MTLPGAYPGLRGWLEQVEALGELQKIRGAHWDLEIGALTEMISARHQRPPALLFDAVPGYPEGFRVLTNLVDTPARLALAVGLPPNLSQREFIQHWRRHAGSIKPLPPREVPLAEHFPVVQTGDEVDLMTLPVPRWHEGDGGRYLGTATMTVTRDPDEGWVNGGLYRVMVRDSRSLIAYISPGKHGRVHRDKYFAKKQSCPVVISFGHDPVLFVTASLDVPYGLSEFEYAGGLYGAPVPVVRGPATGLPIPADAEIAIEGEMAWDEADAEGPFGEWTGYYASSRRAEPVLRVKTLLRKADPILCGAPPMPPSAGKGNVRNGLLRSGLIWNALEEAGVPDVQAVWMPPCAGRFMTVVSIRQRYPGHARQAGIIAGQCRPGAYLGRVVVVVDEDVDLFNLEDVMWAICSRCDPEEGVEILRRAWSGPLDPAIHPDRKGFNSRMVIDATRPFEWRDRFPAVSGVSPALRSQMLERWRELFQG